MKFRTLIKIVRRFWLGLLLPILGTIVAWAYMRSVRPEALPNGKLLSHKILRGEGLCHIPIFRGPSDCVTLDRVLRHVNGTKPAESLLQPGDVLRYKVDEVGDVTFFELELKNRAGRTCKTTGHRLARPWFGPVRYVAGDVECVPPVSPASGTTWRKGASLKNALSLLPRNAAHICLQAMRRMGNADLRTANDKYGILMIDGEASAFVWERYCAHPLCPMWIACWRAPGTTEWLYRRYSSWPDPALLGAEQKHHQAAR